MLIDEIQLVLTRGSVKFSLIMVANATDRLCERFIAPFWLHQSQNGGRVSFGCDNYDYVGISRHLMDQPIPDLFSMWTVLGESFKTRSKSLLWPTRQRGCAQTSSGPKKDENEDCHVRTDHKRCGLLIAKE